MEIKNQNKNIRPKKRWLWFLIAIFFMTFISVIALIFRFEYTYANKIYPNVFAGSIDLTGLNKEQALSRLGEYKESLEKSGLEFIAGGKTAKIDLLMISKADPDLSKPVLIFDWEKTVSQAMLVGRRGNLLNDLREKFLTSLKPRIIEPDFTLYEDDLKNMLIDNFFDQERFPVNAKLEFKDGQAIIISGQSGHVFNYQEAIDALKYNLKNLKNTKIELELDFTEAEIKEEDAQTALIDLEKILPDNQLILIAENNRWTAPRDEFLGWLELKKIDGTVKIGLNREGIEEYLQEIAQIVNVAARDAKFNFNGVRVTEFQPSRDGKELDIDQTLTLLENAILLGQAAEIELPIKTTAAQILAGDLNELGIKELIGRGTSNFAGSPANRRHNIATGAAALNGIIIKPEEVFSLIKSLGPIDGEHGYKQELVIKGNRTIPEYGGGLCQIGTTAFRVALRSGLPILERRPHTYRVTYYEPAGMDATIYSPSPDVKFKNDTDGHILFITRIEGDILVFEFYGTKDGRKVTISPDPPSIYNVTSPGPPRYIETDDLEPGIKKKIESAHAGATTHFKYTVTYENGETREQDFTSKYVAWPEVWLIGAEKEEASDSAPTTTGEFIE